MAGGTFAEKFEQAMADLKERDPDFSLRALARRLAKGDPRQMEIIRRRLHKYRPPKGGGSAAKPIVPTDPTRWEIEAAMGLERDALKPDPDEVSSAASAMVADLLAQIAPLRAASQLAAMVERGELVMSR